MRTRIASARSPKRTPNKANENSIDQFSLLSLPTWSMYGKGAAIARILAMASCIVNKPSLGVVGWQTPGAFASLPGAPSIIQDIV